MIKVIRRTLTYFGELTAHPALIFFNQKTSPARELQLAEHVSTALEAGVNRISSPVVAGDLAPCPS